MCVCYSVNLFAALLCVFHCSCVCVVGLGFLLLTRIFFKLSATTGQ